jgi:NitT/TauT family transport system ATP-binding protein
MIDVAADARPIANSEEYLEVNLENVAMAYGRGAKAIQAVDNVSLKIRRGEVVALIGPSGCGKSTTLRMVANLIRPTSGSVHVFGRTRQSKERMRFDEVAMMFQQPALLDWRTVEGNVTLPLEALGLDGAEARRRARAVLETVGLGGFAGRRPYELSGGMQQRVAMARVLVVEPRLLLLDEPFGALDAITRDKLCLELAALCSARKMSALLVTHSISEAIFLADRVLVMSQRPGRIIQELDIPIPRPRDIEDRTSELGRALESELLRTLVVAG